MSMKDKLEKEISLNEAKIETLVNNAVDIMNRMRETASGESKIDLGDIYTFKSLKSGAEALEKIHSDIVKINAENDKLKFILAEEK